MTDFVSLLQPDRGQTATTIHLVDKDSFKGWLSGQGEGRRKLIERTRFDGKTPGAVLVLPADGRDPDVVAAVAAIESLTPWCLAKAADQLPEGAYRLADGDPAIAALGWLLAQHRFDRYRPKNSDDRGGRVLLTAQAAGIDRMVRLAEATALVRDPVDTPAADMGPADLEKAVRDIAARHGARVEVTSGDILASDYPMIQAVGQGASRDRAPRLIELHWGKETDPRLAIVGKGVCFDSGGLDIKPASGMRIMKMDMGGAAHALAPAALVMGEGIGVRLHLAIPAVENSISATAFRPGDIIASRKGLSVEIDNTDAEGRLVLGDALARVGEDNPDLIIDYATLTGAARVALGPDLPAMFANADGLAAAIEQSGDAVSDPVWRLPLWDGYDEMLKSDIADLVNSAESSFAGSITAALFLRRFVPDNTEWVHFDTFAWRPATKPGRPKGGEAMGLRAVFSYLRERYADPG